MLGVDGDWNLAIKCCLKTKTSDKLSKSLLTICIHLDVKGAVEASCTCESVSLTICCCFYGHLVGTFTRQHTSDTNKLHVVRCGEYQMPNMVFHAQHAMDGVGHVVLPVAGHGFLHKTSRRCLNLNNWHCTQARNSYVWKQKNKLKKGRNLVACVECSSSNANEVRFQHHMSKLGVQFGALPAMTDIFREPSSRSKMGRLKLHWHLQRSILDITSRKTKHVVTNCIKL